MLQLERQVQELQAQQREAEAAAEASKGALVAAEGQAQTELLSCQQELQVRRFKRWSSEGA